MTVKIQNRKDLETFHDRVFDGELHLDAVLENDIDLEWKKWEPLYYNGTFDGAGHTISGLYINNYMGTHVGLFSCLEYACVKNLTVKGTVVGRDYVGGIAGSNVNSSIINCNNYARCEGHLHTAGICGYGGEGVEIIGCTNYGEISGNTPFGIYGNLSTPNINQPAVTIRDCRNEGNLFVRNCIDIDALRENKYRYNQIGGEYKPDLSNKQKGPITFENHNSLFGNYARYYYFPGKDYESDFSHLLSLDPDPEYRNDLGDTYLHLLCQNTCFRFFPDRLSKLILTLAENTRIDFGAVNKDGFTAEHFMRKSVTGRVRRGMGPVVKLINEIEKDTDRIGQEEETDSFSTIGF